MSLAWVIGILVQQRHLLILFILSFLLLPGLSVSVLGQDKPLGIIF
ncbi:hypothetical protein [Siphonobacter sp. SORGH_AS_0500]|nr:hypothetical protein [Siphonobacter sp. SORGH_AS_0500]